MLDKNGYPTEETLEKIKSMDCEDFHVFMDFIKSVWWMPDFGFQRDGEVYYLSTGGWSGNEDVIEAMKSNFVFWMLYWEKSVRGGHYTFGEITEFGFLKELKESEGVVS